MKNEPKEEASFADLFIAATYRYCKTMGMTAHEAKFIEPRLASYRDDMRRAQRFVLDDDFVRYATEISSRTTAEKLLSRLHYAVLPYETTWIEFSLPVKVHAMRAFHGLDPHGLDHDIGRYLGLLLHRINDTDFVCEIVCEMHNMPATEVTPCMIAFYVSQDERPFVNGSGHCTGVPPGEGTMEGWIEHISRGALWGYSGPDAKNTMLESTGDLVHLSVPTFLMRHGTMVYSRLCRGVASVLYPRKNGRSMLAQIILSETTEFTGMMRWVITVLSMLGEVPVRSSHVKPEGHVRMGLTGKRRQMDFHRLTLRLPKTKPLEYIERKLRNSPRHRNKGHRVMQHWRTYLHDTYCVPDQHDWTYDHDHGYRLCGKCMSFSRLIPDHVRGDPSLGWVEKSYVIKKDPDA
jgi:hypothetical protein